MQRHYSDFLEVGAELYAISVDAPDVSKAFFVGRNAVQFPILSDQDMETIEDYGVIAGISNIAIPSAFILDKDGVIRWKFIGDTTTRANVDIMLQQLETLNLETPQSFTLLVSAGTSLVHLPRLVAEVNGASLTVTQVSDLFEVLGGETNVHWLITTPAPARGGETQFQAFFRPSDVDFPGNASIQPYTGILVSLRNAISIDLTGDPVEGAVRIIPGPNLVGIPNTNTSINRVSDFARFPDFLARISLISIYANGTFHPFLPEDIASGALLDDLEILPGQAFVVVAEEAWFPRF